MIIDLSSILKDSAASMELSEKLKLENTDFLGEEFVFPDGLFVNGRITNNTKSLHLLATVTGTMIVHCARCMKEINSNVEFEVSEVLVRDDEGSENIDEDVVVFSGHTVDIDDIIINHFLMNVEAKFLCSEDCKGLCPKCGQDLNVKDCDCSDDEIDPRWAALAEIIKNSDTE